MSSGTSDRLPTLSQRRWRRGQLGSAQPKDASWRFELVTTLPGVCFGPVLCKQHVHTSPQILQELMNGTLPMAPDLTVGVVDVRDVAKAHVDALESASAAGRYIFVHNNWSFFQGGQVAGSSLALLPNCPLPFPGIIELLAGSHWGDSRVQQFQSLQRVGGFFLIKQRKHTGDSPVVD